MHPICGKKYLVPDFEAENYSYVSLGVNISGCHVYDIHGNFSRSTNLSSWIWRYVKKQKTTICIFSDDSLEVFPHLRLNSILWQPFWIVHSRRCELHGYNSLFTSFGLFNEACGLPQYHLLHLVVVEFQDGPRDSHFLICAWQLIQNIWIFLPYDYMYVFWEVSHVILISTRVVVSLLGIENNLIA